MGIMEENEYFNYLYKIVLKQSNKEKIPNKTLTYIIEHFKVREDYEKCQKLFEIIQENEKNI